jgi:hypothetical protein
VIERKWEQLVVTMYPMVGHYKQDPTETSQIIGGQISQAK